MLIGVGLVLDDKDMRSLLILNASENIDSEILLLDIGQMDIACQRGTVLGEQGLDEHAPQFSKRLPGFIRGLRARPFDQPANHCVLREFLGRVIEEIRLRHVLVPR